MKKLKALEILKDHIIDLENMALIFEEYCMYKSRDETNKAIQKLTEAIAELETLQNRSCSNCKYYHDEVCCNDNSLLCADFVNENFYCNKWEIKNES